MYLLYMDESGDPFAWSGQNNFVLAAVAVHEGQVFHLGRRLDDIQDRFFANRQLPLGFHAEEIRAGRSTPFSKLLPPVRQQLLTEIYDSIAAAPFPHLVAFATVMDVSSVTSPHQCLRDTFQDVLQRFNIFLSRGFSQGLPNKGLPIIDQSHQARYREFFADFKRTGTQFQGPLANVIDIPYFAGRNDTRMLQLADFLAYATFRRYEHNDPAYFRRILGKFDRRATRGPIEGLKHFTRAPSCSCEACSSRNTP